MYFISIAIVESSFIGKNRVTYFSIQSEFFMRLFIAFTTMGKGTGIMVSRKRRPENSVRFLRHENRRRQDAGNTVVRPRFQPLRTSLRRTDKMESLIKMLDVERTVASFFSIFGRAYCRRVLASSQILPQAAGSESNCDEFHSPVHGQP